MQHKLVSVIIPVYNGALFIADALKSVQQQTHRQWECIIVNDGSTDTTDQVIKDFIKDDYRFVCITQVNKGLSGARNTGLKNAKGNYIQFLDADDVLLPYKLEKQLAAHFYNSTGIIVSYTDYCCGKAENIFVRDKHYVSPKFYSNKILPEFVQRWEEDLSIPPHCFLFSANIFSQKNIAFDEGLRNHEDFDCWLRIFQLNPAVKFLDEQLCIYRLSSNSMSTNTRAMGEGFLQSLQKYIDAPEQYRDLKKILIMKRRKVLKSYNRIDLMTFREKLLCFSHLSRYYYSRIFQKDKLSF